MVLKDIMRFSQQLSHQTPAFLVLKKISPDWFQPVGSDIREISVQLCLLKLANETHLGRPPRGVLEMSSS